MTTGGAHGVTRPTRLRKLFVAEVIAATLFLLTSSSAFAATPTNYNVLFLAVDDLRPELGAYGASHMVTPNMDRLAQSGRVFKRHYVAVPTCGASRYALMLGKRPTTMLDTSNAAFDQLPTTEGSAPESFPHLFRRNGWRTAVVGKVSDQANSFVWNSSGALGGDDRGRTNTLRAEMPFSWNEIIFGPDKWGARVNPLFNYGNGTGRTAGGSGSPAYEIGTNRVDDDYMDGQIAQSAIAKLEEYQQENTRFMMAVGFFRPHLPFNAPKSYFDLYDPNTLPGAFPNFAPTNALPGTASQSGELNNYNHGFYPGDPAAHTDDNYRRKLRHAYYACVSYTDAQIGKVLDALDTLGLAENTIVVLWGDHGWCLDDYNILGKHIVLERGVHSPLIVRVPGMKFPGRTADGIVETIDIYPTLAKLCGMTPPANVNGTSFIPMLNNPDAPGKGWAYSRDIDSSTQDSVRTDRWRLIRVNTAYDLYDFQASPYEVNDVSAVFPDVVNDLANNKLNVQSARVGTTNFNVWRIANFSPAEQTNAAISGLEADPDLDGVSNIFEFLSATDPKNSGDSTRLIGEVRDLSSYGLGSSYFTTRLTASSLVDDIAFSLEGSADLENWSENSVTFLASSSLGNGRFEYLFRDTNPVTASAQKFIRLTAEQTR